MFQTSLTCTVHIFSTLRCDHVCDIAAKAHKLASLIHRCFVSRNTDLLVRAFKVYVRPLLEYNSVIWSPSTIQDIEAIERVRRFTKRLGLHWLHSLPYKLRLQCFYLQSLEHRRLLTDLMYMLEMLSLPAHRVSMHCVYLGPTA